MMTTMFGRPVFDDSAAVSVASGDKNRAAMREARMWLMNFMVK
jgi:hypothetical protein